MNLGKPVKIWTSSLSQSIELATWPVRHEHEQLGLWHVLRVKRAATGLTESVGLSNIQAHALLLLLEQLRNWADQIFALKFMHQIEDYDLLRKTMAAVDRKDFQALLRELENYKPYEEKDETE